MDPTITQRARSTANGSAAEIGTSLSATSTPNFTAVSTSGSCIRKRAAMLCALSIALPWIPTMVAVDSVGEDVLENSASSVSSHQSSLKRVDGWNDRDERVVRPHQHTCEPISLSGDSDSSTSTTAASVNPLCGQVPADAVNLKYWKPVVTPPQFTTAAAATSAPNVARGTLMVSVDCSNDYNENQNRSPTSPKRERSPQDRRRQRPEKRGKVWGGQGASEVSGGRGLAFRPPSDLLESRDEALVSNRGQVPRDSGWRTGSNDGETSSTRSEATEPGVLSSSAQNQAAGAGISAPSNIGDGQQHSPLPAQQVESQTSPPSEQQHSSSSQGWTARAGDSGSIVGSPLGVLASQGDGSMIAVFAGVMMAALPELLRACKLMAVAGFTFRGMRWLTGVIRVARPRMKWRHEDDWPEGRAKRGQAIREGASLRRARESLCLRASGMRVPFDVISGLDEAELEVSADIVDCDEIDVMFGDIAGMEDIKHSLQEIISESLDFPPDLYPARLIKPCTGVLIYGPPGCGKTLLARAVAKQSGAAFISVKASTLIRQPGLSRMGGAAGGGGGGYSSLMVRAVFSLAKKIQPCVIFFDEADGLCLKREEGDAGSEREVMTELMQLWDGLSSSGQDRVVVLAATNRPWDLDPAIQRRFSRSFQVRLPDRQMRKAVLMKALEDIDVEEGFDWREVAVMTEGYSCGDVVELCREAVRGPLREAIERNRRWEARRLTQGLHQTRMNSVASQREQQRQQQQQRRRRHRGESETGGTIDASATATTTVAAAAASAEAVQLPHVRMRPLRMSDITTAQRRVVPTFWQAEAYRTTYDSYMCSLMEHAKKNWSQ